MAEQLVAAADGEKNAAARNVGCELLALSAEFAGNGQLVAVCPAAEKHDVRVREVELLAHHHLVHARGDAAPRAALGERRDVATVTVEIERVGVEVHDAQRSVQRNGHRLLARNPRDAGGRCAHGAISRPVPFFLNV